MKNDLISIIIPVYKVEKYLEYLAETLGCSFERYFVLPDGEKI